MPSRGAFHLDLLAEGCRPGSAGQVEAVDLPTSSRSPASFPGSCQSQWLRWPLSGDFWAPAPSARSVGVPLQGNGAPAGLSVPCGHAARSSLLPLRCVWTVSRAAPLRPRAVAARGSDAFPLTGAPPWLACHRLPALQWAERENRSVALPAPLHPRPSSSQLHVVVCSSGRRGGPLPVHPGGAQRVPSCPAGKREGHACPHGLWALSALSRSPSPQPRGAADADSRLGLSAGRTGDGRREWGALGP